MPDDETIRRPPSRPRPLSRRATVPTHETAAASRRTTPPLQTATWPRMHRCLRSGRGGRAGMGRAGRGAAPPTAPAAARRGRESRCPGAARRAADRLRLHRGVLVEKGQSTSSSSSAGGSGSLAARFAALRGGTSGAGATGGAPAQASGGGGAATGGGSRSLRWRDRNGRWRRSDRRPGGVSVWEHAVCDHRRRQHRQGHDIARLDRHEDRESRGQGHPSRRNRLVTGAAGANGAISAESIRVGARRGRRPRRAVRRLRRRRWWTWRHAAAAAHGTGGEPALFGKGG